MGAVATGNFFIHSWNKKVINIDRMLITDISMSMIRLCYLQENTWQLALQEEFCVTLHCPLEWSPVGCYPWKYVFWFLLKYQWHKNETIICPPAPSSAYSYLKTGIFLQFFFVCYTIIKNFAFPKFSPLLPHLIVKGNKWKLFLFTNKPNQTGVTPTSSDRRAIQQSVGRCNHYAQ